MEFKDLEEAIEYINNLEKEKNELQQQFDNQKIVIDKNVEVEKNLNKEIERLKIANYDLYQRIDVTNNKEDNNQNHQDNTDNYTIDDLIKDMD